MDVTDDDRLGEAPAITGPEPNINYTMNLEGPVVEINEVGKVSNCKDRSSENLTGALWARKKLKDP